MKFTITGVDKDGVVTQKTVDADSKHYIEFHRMSYGFVSIINIKQHSETKWRK